MTETCLCRTGLNRFKPWFKPPLAETCQPWYSTTSIKVCVYSLDISTGYTMYTFDFLLQLLRNHSSSKIVWTAFIGHPVCTKGRMGESRLPHGVILQCSMYNRDLNLQADNHTSWKKQTWWRNQPESHKMKHF